MRNIRNKRRIKQVICAILGLCSALFLTTAVYERSEVWKEVRAKETQQGLAEEVLRFHVLANSDSEADQALKLCVRDAILSYMKTNLPEGCSETETEEWVQNHLKEIVDCARGALRKAGSCDRVSAELTQSYFPDKYYGDLWFPKGYYQALRVVIGEGAGHNWWCVLYPNLCITEASSVVVSEEGKDELENILTEEEYETVTISTRFEIKSFLWEKMEKLWGKK